MLKKLYRVRTPTPPSPPALSRWSCLPILKWHRF